MSTTVRAALLALVISAVVAPSGLFAQGSLKLAYVNSQMILEQAPGRRQAMEAFEKEMGPFQARLKAMDDSLTAMIQAYQTDEPTLTPEARNQRTAAIREKQSGWQVEANQMEEQAAQRRMELEQPLMELLTKVLNDVRIEDGYAFIFDVSADGHGIVSADRNLDITEKVLARYKAATPAVGAQPAPQTGAPVPTSTGVTRPRIPPSR